MRRCATVRVRRAQRARQQAASAHAQSLHGLVAPLLTSAGKTAGTQKKTALHIVSLVLHGASSNAMMIVCSRAYIALTSFIQYMLHICFNCLL